MEPPDVLRFVSQEDAAEGGVEASFDFRAAFNATTTRMMTAVLRNQQAGTEYA